MTVLMRPPKPHCAAIASASMAYSSAWRFAMLRRSFAGISMPSGRFSSTVPPGLTLCATTSRFISVG